MPHRCAFGCKNTDVVMHVFPNPEKFPELFKAWINLCHGKLETFSDYEVYKKKRICDIHFADEHRNRFKRLNALAVPTLHLPGLSGTCSSRSVSTTELSESPGIDLPKASSSSQPVTATEVFVSSAGTILSKLSSSSQVATNPPEPSGTHLSKSAIIDDSIAAKSSVIKEHNYSKNSRPRRNEMFKDTPGRTPAFNTILLKPLKTKIRCLQTEICRLRKKGKSFKQRLANANKLSNDQSFQQITKYMTKPAQLFVHMQGQTKKKSKGRRFSLEEKVMALSLYKKSPKCYKLLCKYFTLPSSKGMRRLLSHIKLSPGINRIIFEKIKKTMAEKDVPDRLCSLSFDEMSITPQISYNRQKDHIAGFSNNKDTSFADHVLVFMVKGVKQKYKQPIAYYFTNCLNKVELKNLIKTVVQHAQESGIIVLNTVCDQSPVNVGAITELVTETKENYIRQGKEWRHDMFTVKGKQIIPIYDTPHLIKGLRNNLITKDLLYTTATGQENVIKWKYFQMLYAADKSYGELRLLDKITEEHVNPDKIKKMRVKSATQLFSHSVAVATEHLTARGDLPEECRQLIDFILLIDNLFDSLNGSSLSIPNGKVYKGPVKRSSPHHQLWKNAKKVLKTVKFVQKKK